MLLFVLRPLPACSFLTAQVVFPSGRTVAIPVATVPCWIGFVSLTAIAIPPTIPEVPVLIVTLSAS